MNLQQKFLDLDKVFKLDDKKCGEIMSMYRDMINYLNHSETEKMGQALYNTLFMNGFLLDLRDVTIDGILNENNSINN